MNWSDFREWFLLGGSIITMWGLYALSLVLAISCHWPRNLKEKKVIKKQDGHEEFKYIRLDLGKEARKGLAFIFAFCATVVLIYSLFPFNFEMLFNIGGLNQ